MGFLYTPKSFIHPVSADYFARVQAAGGEVTDKRSVDEFVVELAKLIPPEMWNCWLMRSTQNIGSGNNVYPIGGNKDVGVLANSPTWTTEGISFGTTTTFTANGSIFPKAPDFSCTACFRRDNNPGVSSELHIREIGGNGAHRRNWRLRINDTNKTLSMTKASSVICNTTNGYTADDNFALLNVTLSEDNNGDHYRNAVLITKNISGTTFSSAEDCYGVRINSDSTQIFTCAFLFYLPINTSIHNQAIYDICKNTILSGLLT